MLPYTILALGLLLLGSLLIKALFSHLSLSPVAGYIIMGWGVRLTKDPSFFPEGLENILYFLAEIGIITILFQIGLKSHITSLIKQLKRASIIAFFNIGISALFTFSIAYYLLNLSFLTSSLVGIAFAATSMGITIPIWEKTKAINKKEGQVFTDLAALDDIIVIIGMALFFDLIPILQKGTTSTFTLLYSLGFFLLKLLIFIALCYVFSCYFEKRVMKFLKKFEKKPDPMISVTCISFIIASIAAIFEYSFALGAFFAGLAFSRDPEAIKMTRPFQTLHDFFAPFFFITIGFQISIVHPSTSLFFGLILLIPAILGKFFGTALPSYLMGISKIGSVVLGVSMIARAEVAMLVIERGRFLGDWLVNPNLFDGVVLVILITSIFTPILLQSLLKTLRKPAS